MIYFCPKSKRFSKFLFCICLSFSAVSCGRAWQYKNEERPPICYNANNNLGLCVPLEECALAESACERDTGEPPFVCCTKNMRIRAKTKKSIRNDRIIFPDDRKWAKKSSESKSIDLKGQRTSTHPTILKQVESDRFKENISSDFFLRPPNCGRLHVGNRIYGGQNAGLTEFPWMTILEFRNQTTGRFLMDCAGSLISNRYVLTVAHCVQGDILRNKGQLVSVRVGEYNTESETDCDESRCLQQIQQIPVETVIPHPGYVSNSYNGMRNQHDIALIRLQKPVEFNEVLQPVCLPDVANSREFDESTKFFVAGWGHNGTMVRTAVKQKLELPLVKHAFCREIFKNNFYLADEQICAGGRFREDSCNGDSGGPLMRIERGHWLLEGIVSFGLKCGLEKPGIYTSVRHYIGWINENVKFD